MINFSSSGGTTFKSTLVDVIAPKVLFSRQASLWMSALAELHETEVGFYGIVDKEVDGSYVIREIIYPKHQLANCATCEISPDGEASIMNYLIEAERQDDIAKLKMWGHSHVNMGVFASSQDEHEILLRMNETKEYQIRVICNKKGDVSISFFDYDNRLRYDNIPYVEQNYNNEYDDVVKTVTEMKKVNIPSIIPFTPPISHGIIHGAGAFDDDDYANDKWPPWNFSGKPKKFKSNFEMR